VANSVSRHSDISSAFAIIGHKDVNGTKLFELNSREETRLNLRVKAVGKLPIFCSFLEELKLQGRHNIDQAAQQRAFFRFDDLTVHLRNVSNYFERYWSGRTGRSGGDMIRLM
jgi:hypothetical protein